MGAMLDHYEALAAVGEIRPDEGQRAVAVKLDRLAAGEEDAALIADCAAALSAVAAELRDAAAH